MNLKTTLSLMLVLVVLVMGLYLVRSSPRADENASLAASPLSPSDAGPDLVAAGLGAVGEGFVRPTGGGGGGR